jgi:exodeoxyribonuclease VII large subunit
MAVPVRAELMLDVDSFARRALSCWRRHQEARWTELRSAARALPNAEEVLALPRQRLDHAAARLAQGLRANAHIHHVQFSRVATRLSAQMMRGFVERRRERFSGLTQRLRAGVAANSQAHRARLSRERDRVSALGERSRRAVHHVIAVRMARAERGGQLLAAFSYRGVLTRGFALVRDASARPLHSAAAVTAGMPLEIEFADGRVGAHADGAAVLTKPTSEPVKPRLRKGGGQGPENQGDLF